MTVTTSHRGFTLVETLVAIAVMTTAIIGPFVAIQAAINAGYTSRDQLTATMLAQEGIEYVRSIRDGNYMHLIQNPSSTRSWLYGLDGTDDGAGNSLNCVDPDPDNQILHRCLVDPFAATTVTLCSSAGSGPCDPLNFTAAGSYTHGVGTPSRFTRHLAMESLSATEMKIVVTVTFTSAHKPYSVRIEEVLYNWL